MSLSILKVKISVLYFYPVLGSWSRAFYVGAGAVNSIYSEPEQIQIPNMALGAGSQAFLEGAGKRNL